MRQPKNPSMVSCIVFYPQYLYIFLSIDLSVNNVKKYIFCVNLYTDLSHCTVYPSIYSVYLSKVVIYYSAPIYLQYISIFCTALSKHVCL